VASIEERKMIPEAVMECDGTTFRIYVQSNFGEVPGMVLRRRFSLAHEIIHTFFYELREGMLRPIPGAPSGTRLEAACHKGAALLLVPEQVLRQELVRSVRPIRTEQILTMSRQFAVSTEVMLRRLNDASAFDEASVALVLIRDLPNERAKIECATCPLWLRVLLPQPGRGVTLESWLSGCNQHKVLRSLLSRSVRITGSLRIVELEMGTEQFSFAQLSSGG
jgi:hypothetical protein